MTKLFCSIKDKVNLVMQSIKWRLNPNITFGNVELDDNEFDEPIYHPHKCYACSEFCKRSWCPYLEDNKNEHTKRNTDNTTDGISSDSKCDPETTNIRTRQRDTYSKLDD